MSDIKIIRSAVLLLFCVFLVCGCQPANKEPIENEFPLVDSDMRKLELQRLLARKYNNPKIHYELGKIYQSEGLWDKAIFEFDIAKSYDPVNWESAAAIVKTLYQDGKKERAIAMAAKYIKQAGFSAASSLGMGKAFQYEMLDDEALASYNQALTIAPNSAVLNMQIGYFYREKNDLVRAEQYLRRSFELNPTSEVSEALGRLGIRVELPGAQRIEPEKTDGAEGVK
ncbi:MAG: hypothetical protein FVQ82_07075 [Planctomycetes bacterium]|nr:hypothetical protein [Planctomycetota bacterium]